MMHDTTARAGMSLFPSSVLYFFFVVGPSSVETSKRSPSLADRFELVESLKHCPTSSSIIGKVSDLRLRYGYDGS